MTEVKVVGVAGAGVVAEERARRAAVRRGPDGAIRIRAANHVGVFVAGSHRLARTGAGRTIRVQIAGQTVEAFARLVAFLLHGAERLMVFKARVQDILLVAVTPLDGQPAQRHLLVGRPTVERD